MFDAYKRAAYPYIEATGRSHRDRTAEILERAFVQGPFVIKNLSDKEKYEVKEDDQ